MKNYSFEKSKVTVNDIAAWSVWDFHRDYVFSGFLFSVDFNVTVEKMPKKKKKKWCKKILKFSRDSFEHDISIVWKKCFTEKCSQAIVVFVKAIVPRGKQRQPIFIPLCFILYTVS